MFCNATCVFIWHLASIIHYSSGPCCYYVVLASLTVAAVCCLSLERRESHDVPSPYVHSCMLCATVYITVMPSFLDITEDLLNKSEKNFKLPMEQEATSTQCNSNFWRQSSSVYGSWRKIRSAELRRTQLGEGGIVLLRVSRLCWRENSHQNFGWAGVDWII